MLVVKSSAKTWPLSTEETAKIPSTHKAEPEWAMLTLDYADMVALSQCFEVWAFDEPDFDGVQRTSLIMLCSDYEALADFCGPEWKAAISMPDDMMVTIARRVRRHQRRGIAMSAYLDRRPSYLG